MSLFSKDLDIRKETSIDERLNDLGLHVKDFGAKGNDATDDTSAIKAAIDAIVSQGGGKLILTPLIRIDQDIYLPSNIELVGSKSGSKIIGTGNIYIVGTMTSESSDILEQNARNSNKLKIAKGLSLTQGDDVIIRGSMEEMEGGISDTEKVRHQELHTVASVTPDIDFDIVEFENEIIQLYPIQNSDGSLYTVKPTITKVDNLIENVTVSNVKFSGVMVFVRVARNITFDKCRWNMLEGRAGRVDWDISGSTNHGAVSDITFSECKIKNDYVDSSERKALLCLCGVTRGSFNDISLIGCFREGLRLLGGVSNTHINKIKCSKVGRRSINLIKPARVTIRNAVIDSSAYMRGIDENTEAMMFDHSYDITVDNARFNNTRGTECIEFRKFAEHCLVINSYFSMQPGGANSTAARRAINLHAFDVTTPYAYGKSKDIKIINNTFVHPYDAAPDHHFTAIRFDDPVDDLLFDGNTTIAENPEVGRMHATFAVGNANGLDCYNWRIVNNTFGRGCGQVIVRQDLKEPDRRIYGLTWENNTVSAGSISTGRELQLSNVALGSMQNNFFMTANTKSTMVYITPECSGIVEAGNYYASVPSIPHWMKNDYPIADQNLVRSMLTIGVEDASSTFNRIFLRLRREDAKNKMPHFMDWSMPSGGGTTTSANMRKLTITANGTTRTAASGRIYDIKPNTNYVLSGIGTGIIEGVSFKIDFYDQSISNVGTFTLIDHSLAFTSPATAEYAIARFVVDSTVTSGSFSYEDMMLEEGIVKTSYVPYHINAVSFVATPEGDEFRIMVGGENTNLWTPDGLGGDRLLYMSSSTGAVSAAHHYYSPRYRLMPVASTSITQTNVLFVDSTDNILKFRDQSGQIKVVNLT